MTAFPDKTNPMGTLPTDWLEVPSSKNGPALAAAMACSRSIASSMGTPGVSMESGLEDATRYTFDGSRTTMTWAVKFSPV